MFECTSCGEYVAGQQCEACYLSDLTLANIEENKKLYTYIAQIYRSLYKVMDIVGNLDNADDCSYCGHNFNFCEPTLTYTCVNPDCVGNEVENIFDEVTEVCGEKIFAIGQELLGVRLKNKNYWV